MCIFSNLLPQNWRHTIVQVAQISFSMTLYTRQRTINTWPADADVEELKWLKRALTSIQLGTMSG